MTRVLFILKKRQAGAPGSWSYTDTGKPLPSGLSVSATQMAMALDDLGIENKLVQVIDNNCIDREVHAYKPTHVIIEAFWVVPPKFEVLRKLHPTVTWIVRNHSKCDFLSHEGGMIGWGLDYIKDTVTLACNSPEATQDFKALAQTIGADPKYVTYLPNYYRTPKQIKFSGFAVCVAKFFRRFGYFVGGKRAADILNVGCFGAVRPLKNHLHQALAAIEAADQMGMKLRFHINSNRVEGKAEPILKSLRAVFDRCPQHELVELGWLEHDDFTKVVHTMDVVMQVSNTETFNIVSADAVANNVPVLVSDEIPWLDSEYNADPNNVSDIAKKLVNLYQGSGSGLVQADQLEQLGGYVEMAKRIWGQYLTHQESTASPGPL